MPTEFRSLLDPRGKPLSELIGQRVKMRCVGTLENGGTYSSTSSGIYLGIACDDETQEPMHLFGDGEINGIPQAEHGFPARETEPLTFNYGATELIRAFHAGEPFEIDGLPACPKCLNECGTWAEDGESDEPDQWQCTTCGASGIIGKPAVATVLTVQLAVTVRADLIHLGAEGIAQVLMAALHVGLEGAEDAGVKSPDPADVALVFVDNAQEAI